MLALAVAAVMILLTGQFARRGILSGLEWRSVDLRFRFRGPIPPEPEILIIGVDETTFRELGLKYPFPPVIYAELLDRLGNAGAAAVLFDFLYSEPTRECDPPNQDALLAEAIERNGAVVWAVELEAGKHPVEPIPVIRDAVQGLGFINLPDERDSRIRRFLPEKGGFKAFAVAGVEAYAGFVP